MIKSSNTFEQMLTDSYVPVSETMGGKEPNKEGERMKPAKRDEENV